GVPASGQISLLTKGARTVIAQYRQASALLSRADHALFPSGRNDPPGGRGGVTDWFDAAGWLDGRAVIASDHNPRDRGYRNDQSWVAWTPGTSPSSVAII